MSFFKNVMGKFVEFDDKNEAKPTEQAQTKQTTSVQDSEVPSESFNFDGAGIPAGLVNTPISAAQGAFNQEFYQHLQNEIENNDQDGADYFELRKVYDAMKKTMPNDATALSAAFSALRATSPDLTVERLIETADLYLSVVEKEDNDFTSQYESQFQTEVVGREVSIQTELETQAKLQEELAQSQAKVQTLQSEKAQEEQKLNSVKANWNVTMQLVKANIETDKKNITSFLQTAQA